MSDWNNDAIAVLRSRAGTGGENGECRVQLALIARFELDDLQTETLACMPSRFELPHPCRIGRIDQAANPSRAGRELMKQLQPLGSELGQDAGNSGGVPAGARQARRQTGANRIAGEKHDRDLASRQRGLRGGRTEHDDDIQLRPRKLGGERSLLGTAR